MPPERPLVAADPGAGTASPGSVLQAVHGRRSVRYYLVSAHELSTISVLSGATGVLGPVGIFLLGLAGTAWYGNVTTFGGPAVALVSCVLGIIALAGAGVLLHIRRGDVDRIKSETEFPL